MDICFHLANFPEQVVDNLPADVSTGIYYGWASVGSGDVHKMVVSIGWNPYYKNVKKSMVRAESPLSNAHRTPQLTLRFQSKVLADMVATY